MIQNSPRKIEEVKNDDEDEEDSSEEESDEDEVFKSDLGLLTRFYCIPTSAF